MRRQFNNREKQALFVAAGGKCSVCGVSLAKGWHADHMTPYSKGGETDVINGQALCPKCNLQKGSQMDELREWQKEARNRYFAKRENDFLCVATPGAGKTRFALSISKDLLDAANSVESVIVVCPTDHLKRQWAEAASEAGLQLNPKFTADQGRWTSDFRGICATYHAVCMSPDLFRMQSKRSLVIFDEIHHVGDKQPWGAKCRHAFEMSPRRLAMSGTPFRSDKSAIPFVTYDNGLCIPDYSYTYADALKSLVPIVREVAFPTYEGLMRWRNKGIQYEATFSEDLSEDEAAKRLLTAIHADSDWMQQVLRDADERLSEIRKTHTNAGGLVIAKDTRHANELARVLKKITGQSPAIAHSGERDEDVGSVDEKASDIIKGFERGDSKWIVAVKMVSEGVDIKRLRVGVYATNVTTEMFFVQAIGRTIRWEPGAAKEQTAWWFVPKHKELETHITNIKKQLAEYWLEPEKDSMLTDGIEFDGERPESTFIPESAEALDCEVLYETESFSEEELAVALENKKKFGMKESEVKIAQLIRHVLKPEMVEFPAFRSKVAKPIPQTPVFEEITRVGQKINSLVGVLVDKTGRPFNKIHTEYNKRAGIAHNEQPVLRKMKLKLELIQAAVRR